MINLNNVFIKFCLAYLKVLENYDFGDFLFIFLLLGHDLQMPCTL